jgi:hypothetical protein
VDTQKPVTPPDVRDALVNCFVIAHADVMEDLKNYTGKMTIAEFDGIKRLNVTQLIRSMFTDVGGNFDAPTKDNLLKVMDKLKEFAVNFRNPELVSNHFGEILTLVNCLP